MDIKAKTKKPSLPKFNVFDVVIIFILLLAIIIPIVLVIRAESNNNSVGKKEVLYYTVRIDNIASESKEKIAINQTVLERGIELGTVSSDLKSLPCRNYVQTDDGKIDIIEESGLYCVYLTIKATAVYNDVEGYTVNGERIFIGKNFELRFPDFEASCVCTSINEW